MAAVKTGLEILLERKLTGLKDARVGLICHQASVNDNLQHAVPLLQNKKIHLSDLFAPEHGLWGIAQDQIPISSAREGTIPVHSLYGDDRYPKAQSLENIDILICDLQDVGSRYYTFIWT